MGPNAGTLVATPSRASCLCCFGVCFNITLGRSVCATATSAIWPISSRRPGYSLFFPVSDWVDMPDSPHGHFYRIYGRRADINAGDDCCVGWPAKGRDIGIDLLREKELSKYSDALGIVDRPRTDSRSSISDRRCRHRVALSPSGVSAKLKNAKTGRL